MPTSEDHHERARTRDRRNRMSQAQLGVALCVIALTVLAAGVFHRSRTGDPMLIVGGILLAAVAMTILFGEVP